MERFRLLERIGSGGMGTVYRAFDERLHREVAVKEIDAVEPERVLREAQAAARLNHPGIVTLYELGERDGRALLVSELVPGATLARLQATGALSDRDLGAIGADLCEALAHAHARGVVHRDVKPQNVIVCDEAPGGRRAKLMDFGIARVAGAPTLTADGEVVGTLAYMSPEQAEGEVAGPPSDVYSMALTMYECWAGENPVAGSSPADTARRIGNGVPALRDYRPDLAASLTETIDACLDPDPELRPTTLELGACLAHELGGLDPARALPAPHESAEHSRRSPLGLRRLAALTAGIALLVAFAGPLGAGGLAIVLAGLALPAIALAPGPAALAAPCGALFGALAIGGGAPALAALGPRPLERAALGALAWGWMLAAAFAVEAGPRLGIAPRAPDAWVSDASIAADSVLAPLLSAEALAGAAVFALAAVMLGWVLSARHLALALVGAVVWAAALDAALHAFAGGLAGRPVALALAAAAAIAIEFGVLRAEDADPALRRAPRTLGWARQPRPNP